VNYSQDKTQEQFRRQSSLITQAKFLFFSIFKCLIHEARHSICRRECLGEHDRGVGVSFVRNLLEGRSKKP